MMRTLRKSLVVFAAAAALAAAVFAQQSTPAQGSPTTEGMQGMHGQMQNQHMAGIQPCQDNMQSMIRANDRAKRDIAEAKQSNDRVRMRAALDEAEKALNAVDQHAATCMSMIQNMGGMGNTSSPMHGMGDSSMMNHENSGPTNQQPK